MTDLATFTSTSYLFISNDLAKKPLSLCLITIDIHYLNFNLLSQFCNKDLVFFGTSSSFAILLAVTVAFLFFNMSPQGEPHFLNYSNPHSHLCLFVDLARVCLSVVP